MHGNVGARTHTHTHIYIYIYIHKKTLKPTHSPLTHASQSLRQPLPHSPYLHLSFWTPGVLLRISSPQHFILIRYNICPQFNRQCSVLPHCEVCVRVCVCVRAVALCAPRLVWMKQINSFEQYTLCLSNYKQLFRLQEFTQTYCEISADAVIICLFTWYVLLMTARP